MQWAGRAVVLVSCSMALVGCTPPSELARERGAREFSCPAADVKVKWVSYSKDGDIYRVEACGKVATYDCNEMAESCKKESGEP